MRTLTFIIITILTASVYCHAQDGHLSSQKGQSSLGLGIGLPYGGIGIRFGTNISDHLNLFGGLGYQFAGAGYNVGLLKDFKSNSAAQFYILGMYGTNAAIKVDGLSDYDKVYTGASFGVGMKVNSRKKEGNFWDIGLLIPVRSSDFKDDEDAVKNDPRISEFTEAWPILLSIGYNFNL